MSNNNRAEILDFLLDKFNKLDDTQKMGLMLGVFGYIAASIDKDIEKK